MCSQIKFLLKREGRERRVVMRVSGIVQGVNFRYDTKRKAGDLGLNGWVRNEEDGSVIIVAEGEEKSLHQLIEWAKQGPPAAKVEKVQVRWEKPQREKGFRIEF